MTKARESKPQFAFGSRRALAALLLAAAALAPGSDPSAAPSGEGTTGAAGNAPPSCPAGSCPSGFECIDGGCQAANHPGEHPFTGTLPTKTDCPYGALECNVCVDDVRARFKQIKDGFDTDASVYSFDWQDTCEKHSPTGCFTSNMTSLDWHFQSLMRFAESESDGSWLVTTRAVDNGPGRFGLIRMGSFNGSTLPWRSKGFHLSEDLLVSWQRVGKLKDGFLNHASGAQMLGRFLFTGVECHSDPSCEGRKALVRIVDLSNPKSPVQRAFIAVDRLSADAAAARLRDGFLVMSHSDDGGDRLDFYRSSKIDTGWERIGRWAPKSLTGMDRKFGCQGQTYQNTHLVTQCDGKLFIVGMCQDQVDGKDWADLFRMDAFATGTPHITKVAARPMGMAHGAAFWYGGGVYVDPKHRMSLYATEGSDSDAAVSINEFAGLGAPPLPLVRRPE